MIGRLEGRLFEKAPTRVIVDVSGVGYEAQIPLSTFTRLPEPGKTVALCIYTHLRDNALQLYGFATERERAVFELLLHASRVGPKLAQTILSGIEADALVAAIRDEDVATLRAAPGVGAKTAERIIVELRDRVHERFGAVGGPLAPAARAPADARGQLLSALVNLQVPRAQAEKLVEQIVAELGEDAAIEELVRAALPRLGRG